MSIVRTFARGRTPALPNLPELPPTLRPDAIRSAAPPPSRGLNLAATGLLYTLMIGSVALASSLSPADARPWPRTGGDPWIEPGPAVHIPLRPDPDPAPPPPPRNPPGGIEGTRPPDWQPPLVPDAVSDETPRTLPDRDHSRDSLYRADMPVGDGTLRITGDGGRIVGDPGGPAETASPRVVELPSSEVKVLRQVAPGFPPLCRALRIQGTVELLLTVDAGGVPVELQVLASPHPGLAEAAVSAARQWRFVPARIGDQAVPSRFRLAIRFSLR